MAADDESLTYAWDMIQPGGAVVPMTGNLAKSVEQEGSKLRLVGMRKQNGLLYGRCLVARKSGNSARYSSVYFPIGGKCQSGKFTGPIKNEFIEILLNRESLRRFTQYFIGILLSCRWTNG